LKTARPSATTLAVINRRDFLALSGLTLGAAGCASTAPSPARAFRPRPFLWEQSTLRELRQAMDSGKVTARALTRAYLARIAELDHAGPMLRSVIELNPDAERIAEELDRERQTRGPGGPYGPLHGIPILLKDNIDTGDRMMTTAGSLALEGSRAARDAFLAARLRAAGAVLLGKTNLSEWANFRSGRSTSGWSGRGGLTRNPYVLDRNTSGSSSGSGAAVAASLCAASVGTETDGSIISPSSYCGIVGLKPTVGLVSRSGIIPISRTQDTAGPMARTVEDAALLLGALAGEDPEDAATLGAAARAQRDYTRFLDLDGLRGARLGIAREFFRGMNKAAARVLEAAVERLRLAGAELVDPVDLPSFRQIGNAEFEIMLFEFKDGLNRYLAGLGSKAPVKSLAEVIAFNEREHARELRHFGQETLLLAQAKGPLTDPAYLQALEKCRRLSRAEGLDAVMDQHRLDAIVAPSGGPAHRTDLVHGDRDTGGSSSPAAVSGYPSITLPAGYVGPLPVGLSFFGRAWSEPLLLKLACAFEQKSPARRPPQFLETVDAG